jgi:hypothetical protein
MKRNLVSSVLFSFLATTLLIAPAMASTYTVTLRLLTPSGEELYTATYPEKVDNMTLTVPEPLYLMIVSTYGTDEFTTPFNLTFFAAPACILEVTSDPPGFTVTFEPMIIPDFNEDGEVDIFDMVKVARCIEVEVGPPENYDMFVDLNFDLTVDIFDLVQIAQHIGIVVNPPELP